MPEREQMVDTYQITMYCNQVRLEMPCPGRMLPNGQVATNVTPKLYMHVCDSCGFAEAYPQLYPYIKYKPTLNIVM